MALLTNKAVWEQFWLITSRLGLDSYSLAKLKVNFTNWALGFCLDILDSIMKNVPLSAYLQMQRQAQGQ
jgi:hypothetical protein